MAEEKRRCPVQDKVCFTERGVQTWLAEYRRRKTPKMRRMRAYHCKFCDSWHVTKWQNWRPKK